MRRLLLLALLAAACKRDAPPPAEKQPAEVARPSPPAAPPAKGGVTVDDALIARFISFQKKYLDGLPPRLRGMGDVLQKLEKSEELKGPAAGAQKTAADLLEQMKADDKRLRDAAGLTEEQAQVMGDLVMSIGATFRPGGSPTARDRAIEGLRQKHGAAAVDAALRHKDELQPLWNRQMQIFEETMKMMKKEQ